MEANRIRKIIAQGVIFPLFEIGALTGVLIYFGQSRELTLLDLIVLSALCVVYHVTGYWEA